MVSMSSDMLREASESLFEFLINNFPSERSYSRSDIEQDPMPPLLAHFLTQTLQHKLEIEVEHLRSVRSPWFDYDHVDVQNSYKSFVSSLVHHSFIPAEEWRANLKRATKLVIAHLVLPTHTLVEYIFHEGEGPLPAPTIYRQLVYFAAYPYLKEAVEAFLKQRQLKEIDRTRFSSLLTQIDKHMTANYTVDDWLRLLKPMFDLMRRNPLSNKQGVPIDLLSMFFGDKDAYGIQERLQVEKELHRVVMINEVGLRRVIEGSVEPYVQKLVPTQKPEEKAAPKEPEKETAQTPTPSNGEHTPQPETRASQEEDPSAPKPLWEQFQYGKAAPPAKPVSTEREPKPPKSDEPAIPLWMQFQKKPEVPAPKAAAVPQPQPRSINQPQAATPISETPPATTAVDTNVVASTPVELPGQPSKENKTAPASPPPPESMTLEQLEFSALGLYGTSNRDMFIEHLFEGSPSEYRTTLMRLHTLSTWTMASHLIAEEVFKKNNVNIYSPAAIMFTESVEEQYKTNE